VIKINTSHQLSLIVSTRHVANQLVRCQQFRISETTEELQISADIRKQA